MYGRVIVIALLGCLGVFLLSCSMQSVGSSAASGMAGGELGRTVVKGECCALIAHAGGAIDGNAYTNSLEATRLSIDNGFSLIELDFSKTSDGVWFATHDWKYWAERTSYSGALPPSSGSVRELLHSFQSAPSVHGIKRSYTVMSLTDVIGLLQENAHVKVVTDTKDSDLALQLAEDLRSTPVFKQFIFQLYSPASVASASKAVPLQQIILTTYQMDDWWRWDGFGDGFAEAMRPFSGIYAVTVPLAVVVDAPKLKRIQTLGVPVLVHSRPDEINSVNLNSQLKRIGVNGIYVD